MNGIVALVALIWLFSTVYFQMFSQHSPLTWRSHWQSVILTVSDPPLFVHERKHWSLSLWNYNWLLYDKVQTSTLRTILWYVWLYCTYNILGLLYFVWPTRTPMVCHIDHCLHSTDLHPCCSLWSSCGSFCGPLWSFCMAPLIWFLWSFCVILCGRLVGP